jgi:hypothetical protein
LRQMLPEGRLECPDEQAAEILPLEHVFVVSIDDFERLCAETACGEIELASFLRTAVSDNKKPETAKWFFDQHLAGKTSKSPSGLIRDARENAELRMRSALAVVG